MKLYVKIIIPIVVVLIVTVVVMMYKYFEVKAELVKYEWVSSMIAEVEKNITNDSQTITLSGEDIIAVYIKKEEELKEEIIEQKNKYEELYSKLVETEEKLEEYREYSANISQNTQERQYYFFWRGNYSYFKRCR